MYTLPSFWNRLPQQDLQEFFTSLFSTAHARDLHKKFMSVLGLRPEQWTDSQVKRIINNKSWEINRLSARRQLQLAEKFFLVINYQVGAAFFTAIGLEPSFSFPEELSLENLSAERFLETADTDRLKRQVHDLIFFLIIFYQDTPQIRDRLIQLEAEFRVRLDGEIVYETLFGAEPGPDGTLVSGSIYRKVRDFKQNFGAFQKRQAGPPVFRKFSTTDYVLTDFAFFDLETNGASEVCREIMEAALLPADGGKGSCVRFLPYYNNEYARAKYADVLDTINERPEALCTFLHGLEQFVLISHNAFFDVEKLLVNLDWLRDVDSRAAYEEQMAARYRDFSILNTPQNEEAASQLIVDTLDLVHLVFPHNERQTLTAVAAQLGCTPTQSHFAEADTLTLARVTEKIAGLARAQDRIAGLLSFLPDQYLLKAFMQLQCPESVQPHPDTVNEMATVLDQFLDSFLPQYSLDHLDQEPPSYGDEQSINLDTIVNDSFFSAGMERPQAGKEGRPGKQYQILQQVSACINNQDIRMIEAGTGTGKTYGYLLPILHYLGENPSAKFTISTHTKLLQQQIRESICRYAETSGAPVRFAVVMGKENYVCIQRLRACFLECFAALKDRAGEDDSRKTVTDLAGPFVFFTQLLSMLVTPQAQNGEECAQSWWDGYLEDVPFHIRRQFDIRDRFLKRVCCSEGKSPCLSCKWKKRCPVFKKIDDIRNPAVRILVVNDALVMMSEQPDTQAPLSQNTVSFPQLIRAQSPNIIFDEGHRLEETWKNVNATQLEEGDVAGLRGMVRQVLLEPLVELRRHLGPVLSGLPQIKALFQQLEQGVRSFRRDYQMVLSKIDGTVRRFASSLSSGASSIYGSRRRLGGDYASWQMIFEDLFFSGEGLPLIDDRLVPDAEHYRHLDSLFDQLPALVPFSEGTYRRANAPNSWAHMNEFRSSLWRLFRGHVVRRTEQEGTGISQLLQALVQGVARIRPVLDKARTKIRDQQRVLQLLDELAGVDDRYFKELEPVANVFDFRRLAPIYFREKIRSFMEWMLGRLAERDTTLGYSIRFVENMFGGLGNTFFNLFLADTEDGRLVPNPDYDCNDDAGFYTELRIERHPQEQDQEPQEWEAGEEGRSRERGTSSAQVEDRDLFRWKMQVFPADASRELAELLSGYRRAALVSATFQIDPSKPVQENLFAARFGLDQIDQQRTSLVKINSPFNYNEQMRVLVPQHVPFPAGPMTEEHLAESVLEQLRILRMLPHIQGHWKAKALFLLTSKVNLKCTQFLLETLPQARMTSSAEMDLLFQGQRVRSELEEQLQQDTHSVLFGMNSYGEGFDLLEPFYREREQATGPRTNPIRIVCLHKIPFINAAEPVHEAVMARYSFSDYMGNCYQKYLIKNTRDDEERARLRSRPILRTAMERYYIPLSLVTFRQWTGRLIRTRQDSGLLCILDNRLFLKQYGPTFLEYLQSEENAGIFSNVIPYGHHYRKGEDRYSELLQLWFRNALQEQRQISDYHPPSAVLPPVFAELEQHIPDSLLPLQAGLREAGAVRHGQSLAERVRLFLDEFGFHREQGITLHALQEKPVFKLKEALWEEDGSEREQAGSDTLEGAVRSWNLKKLAPELHSAVKVLLSERKRPPWQFLLKQQAVRHNLDSYTAEYLRLAGLMEQKGHPIPQGVKLRSLIRLLEAVNKGLRFLISFEQERVEVLTQYEFITRVMHSGRIHFHVMPTSFGKSLCFQLPALLGDGLTVVFAPTVSLISDQVHKLQNQADEVQPGIDMLSHETVTREEIYQRLASHDRRLKLLYVNPKQLRDPVLFFLLFAHPHIRLFVFDEFHIINYWARSRMMHEYGLVFRLVREYRQEALKRHPPGTACVRPGVVGFSATISRKGFDRLEKDFFTPLSFVHKPKIDLTVFNRPDITMEIRQVDPRLPAGSKGKTQDVFEAKLALLREVILEMQPDAERRLFVFCEYAGLGSLPGVRQVDEFLQRDPELAQWRDDSFAYYRAKPVDNATFHQACREKSILISTEALGMGIDLPHIRQVVNFNLPKSPEYFIQYMGRARTPDMYLDSEIKKNISFYSRAEYERELRRLKRSQGSSIDIFNNVHFQGKYPNSILYTHPPDMYQDRTRYFNQNIHTLFFGKKYFLVPVDIFHKKFFISDLDRVVTSDADLYLWELCRRNEDVRLLHYVPADLARLNISDMNKASLLLERKPGGKTGAIDSYLTLLESRNRMIAALDPGFVYLRDHFLFVLKEIERFAGMLAEQGCLQPTVSNLYLGRGEEDQDYPMLRLAQRLQGKPLGLYITDAVMFLVHAKLAQFCFRLWAPVVAFPRLDFDRERFKARIRESCSGASVSDEGTFHLDFMHGLLLDDYSGKDISEIVAAYEDMHRILVGDGQVFDESAMRRRLIEYFKPEEAAWL